MTNMFIYVLYVWFAAMPLKSAIQPLKITVIGVTQKGTIMIGLYNHQEGFGNTDKTFRKSKPMAVSQTVEIGFNDLPKGNYAVALFQDLNNNGKLDKNFFGIPIEPYGFSNNVKPVFSAPTFNDCLFYFDNNNNVEITLIHP